MSTLTSRQKSELHKAISVYLRPKLSPDDFTKLIQCLEVPEEDLKASDPNLLEKKWSTVIRLQKKILDLETQVSNLNSVIDAGVGGAATKTTVNGSLVHTKINWVPSRTLHQLKGHKASVNSVDIHPLMPELVAGLNDGSFVVWDLLNPVQPIRVINGHTKTINGIAFSHKPLKLSNQDTNGSILVATCSSDMTIKIWDATNNYELKRTLSGHTHSISSVIFKKDSPGHLFSSSRDGSVILWDVTNGWSLKSFVGHSDWVRSLDLSITDEFLISCSNDQSCRLSHGDSGVGLAMMIGHTHVIEDCKFAPKVAWKWLDILAKNHLGEAEDLNSQYDSLGFKYCATASRDETIKIWLLPLPIIRPHRLPAPPSNPSASCLIELKGHHSWVRALQFHPGGKYLFSSSDDKTIKIWDLSAIQGLGVIKCIRTLSGTHEGFINTIKFADPVEFSTTETQNSKMTALEKKGKEKEELTLLDRSIRTIFVSGSTDNTICVWG